MPPKVLLLVLLGMAGCSGEEPKAPVLPQVQRGTASISGEVTFTGTPPQMKQETIACDPRPGARTMLHTEASVVVSKSGGLANVFVFVKGGPKGSGESEPALILNQQDCRFEPHALAIQIGQPLRIRNSDPTFHNVHWDPKHNPASNLGFAAAPALEKVVSLNAAEIFSVRCDVHPWMKGQIGVFDNPFFAVTDGEGKFTIKGLPAGTYTVTTWHELFGAGEEKLVTVAGDAAGDLSFSYRTDPTSK